LRQIQARTRFTINATPRLFCFGLGFSAQVLAARLKSKGWGVAGTTRTRARANALATLGFEAHIFGPGLTLQGFTHILVSVPPGDADPVLAAYAETLLAAKPTWLGYLSTTGVYGNHDGAWIDEETPPAPQSDRARRRLAAEQAWLAWGRASGVPVHIFRLAGIYGPARNQLQSLRDGTARRIVKPGQVFSRIHVEDIATILEASIAGPNPGAIYNVCDDEPAPAHEVVEYAAKLLNMSPPPLERFEDAAPSMSEMALSFYADAKRVKNARIKSELGIALRYPTYREGLTALSK
jgi:nucleoside-diphosphate-sugar epimerase